MIARLFNEQRPLLIAGLTALAAFLILAVVSLFDPTEILGINRWIKPMKFFISFAFFFWTIALFLSFLSGRDRFSRFISWGFITIYVIEMFIIVLQAARGTTSHFNVEEPFDAILYAVMGIAIAVSTVFTAAILYLHFKDRVDLPRAVVWGIRLGLIVFLAGSFEGGYMAAQIGHGVGVKDGGEGLPLTNWSTGGGDLRVAHFLGLHAIQAVPLFAYTLDKMKTSSAIVLTFLFAVSYFAVFSALFIQALMGRPVLAGF